MPLVPAQSAAALEQRTLADERLQEFLRLSPQTQTSSAGAWDLERLTLAALYFHPDLEVAQSRLAVAQAAIRTAAQRPNPGLTIDGGFNATSANPTALTIGTAINLLLELFGKRGHRTEQAEALEAAARHDIATAGWEVRGRVRSAYIDMWAASQRIALSARQLEFQEQLVGFLGRRQVVGEASGLDVSRERVNLDRYRLAERDAERDLATARAALATAIGVPADALQGVAIDFGAIPTAVPPTEGIAPLRRQALTGRSDIVSSLKQYDAAEAALRLQIANQFPNLTLGPGYTYDQGDNKFSLSASADLPIFNQNQGPIAEAVARRRLSAANFEALQATVLGAVDRASADYQASTRSLERAEALLSEQTARQARTKRLFDAGQIDHVTLLAGELELAATELERLLALTNQRRALGAIEDALQQPIFAPASPPATAGPTLRSEERSE
ncbi:MAG: hypothetical protein BGO08_04750 [Altererythrobacter sp. 66-12]|nr:MAG: hypothetical protein BGO08_04750 [Altererythrobacter sp. 66-12]